MADGKKTSDKAKASGLQKKRLQPKGTAASKLRSIFEYEGVTRSEARTKESLRDTEQKLRLIFETLAAGITITDLKGNIVEMNKGALHLHGFNSRDEVVGRSGLELIAEKDRGKALERWIKNLEKGTCSEISDHYTLIKADGTTFEAAVSESVLRDKFGNPEGFISIARDITERKQAEEALKASEEKLRIMFDSMNDAVTVVDMNARIVDANDAAVRLHNYNSRDEIIGMLGAELIAEDERDKVIEYTIQAVREGSTHQRKHCRLLRADGTEFDAEISFSTLHDKDDKLVGFLTISQDITERIRMQEALRDSEEKLRTMFESIQDAFEVIDLEGKFIDVNDAAVRMLGFSQKGELIGESAMDFVAEKDRARVLENTRNIFKNGKGEVIEYTLVARDGREIEAEFSATLLRDRNHNPVGFIGVSRDITERKRANEALRQSEEKFRVIFDNIGDGITVTDAKGTIIAVNDAVVKMGGFKNKEELVGRNGFDLMSAEDRKRIIKITMKAFSEGQSTDRMEYTFVPVQGKPFDADLLLTMLHDKEGKPSGFVALSRDISERKASEEALRKSEEKLRIMFESTSDGIIVLDPALKVVEVNDAAARIYGLKSRDEMIGQMGLQYMDTSSHPEEEEREGPQVELSVSQLRDREGNLAGFISIARDVTARKRMEQKLKEAMDDLKRSNRDLEQFAYVASHDLQEPLRMVSSYTQLLSRRYKGKLGQDADEFIDFAVDGANRMQGMIQALLSFSRVGTRGNPFAETNMEDVLSKALTNLKAAIEDNKAEVTHDPLPTVSVDGIQMVQLLQNLMGNAMKFHGEEPPRIHVSAQERADDWLFSIRDNGIGIDPQYKERIFVIFQRLHSKGEYPGTGIGLAVCRRIVERHGGKIWVESEQGKGSTFFFTLPKSREEEPEEKKS